MNTEIELCARDFKKFPPTRGEPCFHDWCFFAGKPHDGPCDDGRGIYQIPMEDIPEIAREAVKAAIAAGCRYHYTIVPNSCDPLCAPTKEDVYLCLYFVDPENTLRLCRVLTPDIRVFFVPSDWDAVPEEMRIWKDCRLPVDQPEA